MVDGHDRRAHHLTDSRVGPEVFLVKAFAHNEDPRAVEGVGGIHPRRARLGSLLYDFWLVA